MSDSAARSPDEYKLQLLHDRACYEGEVTEFRIDLAAHLKRIGALHKGIGVVGWRAIEKDPGIVTPHSVVAPRETMKLIYIEQTRTAGERVRIVHGMRVTTPSIRILENQIFPTQVSDVPFGVIARDVIVDANNVSTVHVTMSQIDPAGDFEQDKVAETPVIKQDERLGFWAIDEMDEPIRIDRQSEVTIFPSGVQQRRTVTLSGVNTPDMRFALNQARQTLTYVRDIPPAFVFRP